VGFDRLPTELLSLTTLTLCFFVFSKDTVLITDGLSGVSATALCDLCLNFPVTLLL